MPTTVSLHHVTSYHYTRRIQLGAHTVRLRPAPHTRPKILGYDLRITPENHFLNWVQDPFSNYMARLNFPEKTDRFIVDVELIVELEPINPFDFFLEEHAEHFPFEYQPEMLAELQPFLNTPEPGPLLGEYMRGVKLEKQETVTFLAGLIVELQNAIEYTVRLEPGIQDCEHTLKTRIGSCRDSAFLLMHMLRRLGLAARFVSGYLIQLTPDETDERKKLGMHSDFTDLHAWAEVYLPGAGWVGLDATSGLFAGEGHIPLAAVPEPTGAAPIAGTLESVETEFRFHMQVTRLKESPRNTRPYAESTWREILRTGLTIDERINQQGIPLMVGGEPTFTAAENRDAPEWNTAAMGDHKSELAEKLFLLLKDEFAPQGIPQYTQGKWYPGEVLPRWSFNCYWHDNDPLGLSYDGKEAPITDQLEDLSRKLCHALDLDERFLVPAYEDAEYYRWKSERIRQEKEDDDSREEADLDFEEREARRTERLLRAGLDRVVAYALPLEFDSEEERWNSSAWSMPREKCYLIPGDSAPGYRLPLDQVAASDLDLPHSSSELLRTTLTLSIRDGYLYVFLPPLKSLGAFLDLMEGLHAALKDYAWKYRLEGYEPPLEGGLRVLKVTPDPGVIEVNIHPARSFRDAARINDRLYKRAREAGLVADKFLLDGRNCGTGGGQHITLGGPSFEESPFFKNPLLLKRIVLFWQHHPSLAYLFSGLFVGPTSQAPRVDESRSSHLYELEMALAQIGEEQKKNPWVLDRLLRNFLVDVTGNTHRAEICIDKLYSPDSNHGRQGIVELRAFEMPPHARMGTALQVLIRALVSRLWDKPVPEQLIRFGESLHDQFLLPAFIWEDFRQVLADLRSHGYKLKEEWFRPFLEFRMPIYGTTNIAGVELELRMALEPWNVLGETAALGATSRPVDAAIERLEVRLRNFDRANHTLACNGFEVPVHQIADTGEFIGAVRFKAWEPVFTLHPYIPAHEKLIFDLWDHRFDRSLGGCTYFVSHPGGRSYETMPINHREAESRRLSRFQAFGHGRYPKGAPRKTGRKNYYTLDLLLAELEEHSDAR